MHPYPALKGRAKLTGPLRGQPFSLLRMLNHPLSKSPYAHSEYEKHAGTAEPFRVAPPQAAVYPDVNYRGPTPFPAGTRCFSSSNQFTTTVILGRGAAAVEESVSAGFIIKKRLPSGWISHGVPSNMDS